MSSDLGVREGKVYDEGTVKFNKTIVLPVELLQPELVPGGNVVLCSSWSSASPGSSSVSVLSGTCLYIEQTSGHMSYSLLIYI